MASCTTARAYKFIPTKRCIRDIFLSFSRNKTSRFLGYFKHHIPMPEYKEREAKYRETVLRPLEDIPSLAERLKDMNLPDPVLDARIDIGFTIPKKENVSVKDRLAWRKNMADKKRKFLKEGKTVNLDLAEIQEEWSKTDGPSYLFNIADHYGIFEHLFDHGIFTPCVSLNVSYDYDEHTVNPVYMGNILEACNASKAPNVSFNSKPEDLWTLVLTNLDGHLLDTNYEYLHWFIGNIPGGNLNLGEVICDYLQPFPMRGTGYHRLAFVLYKQDKKLDYSSLKKESPCTSLKERTFKTFDFYKEHQDSLTPAGLAFFQCTWDESLTDFFHNVLNMQEPVFEYIEPPVYIKPQVQFPHLEPFNLYLDRYRSPKEIKKEVLLKRLKTVEPFKEESPPPKYPCLHKPEDYKFSWQKRDFELQRLRLGKYRDLRPHSVYPQEDNQFKYDHKV